jgi:uncharacterized protein (TIGR00369 family)
VEDAYGLAQLKLLVGKQVDWPYEKLLGIAVESAERGSVILSATPAEIHDNSMGRTHGGFAASLIDTAMGCAAYSTQSDHKDLGTNQLNIHYVRKIEPAVGKLFAHASIQHAGRAMTTVACRIEDARGTLYAHGTGTFLVYPG